MAVFYSIENQWDVECKGVEVEPNKCQLKLEKKILLIAKVEQEKTSENKVKKLIALGVGSLGAVLLLSKIWFIALICVGVAWFLWQSV
jgi:hypothetical protein